MWKLGALLFIGVGVFNAIATWLDSILTKFGHGSLSGPLGLASVNFRPNGPAPQGRRQR